ncbi:MAG: CidA/LrgA family protein [Lachnospiraceae bacterium]|jgi:holin-like protein|nr:CidA/LrgA family protein [Lachnospiraceae bacterium]
MDAIKYLKQLTIIMAVSFAGEFLNQVLPLPVPGSVYGLLLMFFLLMTKLVRLEQVEDAGGFLVKLMPVLFIGPSVSLITVMGGLADRLVPILAVCLISTMAVMAVTGLTAQAVLKWTKKREEKGHE